MNTTEQGYLIDFNDWNECFAESQAKMLNIVLTDQHWLMIHSLRKFYATYHKCPTMRLLVKFCQTEYDSTWDSAKLHLLFHEPLKQGCKVAGLPKPPHCM